MPAQVSNTRILVCDLVLANTMDVSHFGYFQRSAAREFIVFVARTVAQRTQPGQRQSVQHEEYKVHSHNRNGLCAVAFMDDHYPVQSAFSLLNQHTTYYVVAVALNTTTMFCALDIGNAKTVCSSLDVYWLC
eukprot:XP_020393506.1 VAMP-like protein YKT61 [Zea mays]